MDEHPPQVAAALRTAGVPARAMRRVSERLSLASCIARGSFREALQPPLAARSIVEVAPVRATLTDPRDPRPLLLAARSRVIMRKRHGPVGAGLASLFAAGIIRQVHVPEIMA